MSPCAGDWVLFRTSTSYERVRVEVRQVAKTTPKLVKLEGRHWPRQCNLLDVVGVVPDKPTALRLQDAIAGVSGEFERKRRAAEDERSRRITEALIAANKQVARLIASGIAAQSDETPQEARPEGQEPGPSGDAQ